MNQPIKAGILSFGLSGKIFHAPFLHLHEGFEFVAVVERSEKKAHLEYPGIKSYDNAEEMFQDADIELVVINTPTVTHYEYALRAVEAGKHVLVEKAFTISSQEATHIFDAAKKHHKVVMVYQNRRFDSDYLSVKQILESGKLGKLIEAHFRFDRYKFQIGPKKHKEMQGPGAGLLYDLGPHLIDAAISLFGFPLQFTKRTGKFRPHSQVDDYVVIQLYYPGDLNVFLTASLLVADPQPAFILHGTLGSYVKHRADVQEKQLLENIKPMDKDYGTEEQGMQGRLTTISENGEKIIENVPAIQSSYMNIFNAVYSRIRNGISYPVTKEQVLYQLKILESPCNE